MCLFESMCMSLCEWMFVFVFVSVCVFVWISIFVLYVCVRVSVCVYLFVFVWVNVCVPVKVVFLHTPRSVFVTVLQNILCPSAPNLQHSCRINQYFQTSKTWNKTFHRFSLFQFCEENSPSCPVLTQGILQNCEEECRTSSRRGWER